jgi:hypothetical protein
MSTSHIILTDETVEEDANPSKGSMEMVDIPTSQEEGVESELRVKEKKQEDNSLRGRALALKEVLTGNKLNVLLFCIPFGYVIFIASSPLFLC